jgi:cob(I)alamin adenosyltransferase
VVRIYTRKGDDGTTGLLFGGRVPKDAPAIEANGAVDEAQAALGVARAEVARGSELDTLLVGLERDLWVLMAEVATAPDNRRKLVPGTSAVTAQMVEALEKRIDDLSARTEMPAEFVVPGENRVAALLDVARTVVRRAERLLVAASRSTALDGVEVSDEAQVSADSFASHAPAYLNRLSDLLWTMARWQEGVHLAARVTPRAGGVSGPTSEREDR